MIALKNAVFVDTGAWFSSVVPAESNHLAALQWLSRNKRPLFTTDYVIDETLTLLRARDQSEAAYNLGRRLFAQEIAQLYYLTPDDVSAAWEIFSNFRDKEWSFTDCSSKVVMERLGISLAFAFDQHFHQFGAVAVEP